MSSTITNGIERLRLRSKLPARCHPRLLLVSHVFVGLARTSTLQLMELLNETQESVSELKSLITRLTLDY